MMPAEVETLKYDFYQSDSVLTVTFLIKQVPTENLKVTFEEDKLTVAIESSEYNKAYHLDIELFGKIDPSKSRIIHKKTKIELKLLKTDGIHWKDLKKETTKKPETLPSSYSSRKPVDWEAFVTQSEKEEPEPEGDHAMNKMFQDLYKNADENTRRAMNKSFSESNGTVLSTNWSEIKKEKVKTQLPDGVEFRSWN